MAVKTRRFVARNFVENVDMQVYFLSGHSNFLVHYVEQKNQAPKIV